MHDTNLLEDQPIAWTPTPDVIERAQLTRFMRQVGVTTWEELYEFSIRDVEKFTEEVLKFLDIKFDPPYEKLMDTSGGVEFPSWFISPPRHGDAEGERRATRDGRQESGPRDGATGPSDLGSGISNLGFESAETDLGTRRDKSVPPAVAGGSPLAQSGTIVHAGLNITTVCLDRWQPTHARNQNTPAVIFERENGAVETYGYRELLQEVESCSAGLRFRGLKRGDAIGVHLPMSVETVVALLAINRIGAIAVPVFSGYGVDAIASRMNAVEAKALFTSKGFSRRGKFVDAVGIAREAIERCPTIGNVFVVGESIVPHTAGRGPLYEGYDFLLDFDAASSEPEPTSAEDPLIILYTSGTTGKPKGIAHTHASFPIKAAQDMAFGTDVGRGTRICWYTDIGWMMGPWLIYGALINGATICIYDGAPDYPTPDRMWEFCARHKVEVLGISPTLVRALAAHKESSQRGSVPPAVAGGSDVHGESFSQTGKDAAGEKSSPPSEGGVAAASADGVVLSRATDNHPPAKAVPLLRKDGSPHERHDLSSLRMFASTGEPWNPAPWWWLFEKVGNNKLPIINYSGGTEIAGGILMGNPLLPIKPCSFPAPCPGMDVDILDEQGNPVKAGQVGELVIKQPWIGMARGFWQEKERYLDTYWRRFPNIWVHGDWAMRDKDGHWFILGRSDDTLKVAGKRVGPAEVESLLVAHPLVTEAAVIGVPDEAKGTAMVAFCVLKVTSDDGQVKTEGAEVTASSSSSLVIRDPSLETELKALVARDMGKPLAPSKIHFVSALPKTRNAKVMRRVLRSAYLGEDPGDLSALENPQAVAEIQALRGK